MNIKLGVIKRANKGRIDMVLDVDTAHELYGDEFLRALAASNEHVGSAVVGKYEVACVGNTVTLSPTVNKKDAGLTVYVKQSYASRRLFGDAVPDNGVVLQTGKVSTIALLDDKLQLQVGKPVVFDVLVDDKRLVIPVATPVLPNIDLNEAVA